MKLSVINFIIMHRNSIGLVLCLCLILTGVISIIYDRISKNKFITLCSLFVEKFGARPVEALIYQDGGSFSRLCVMLFLLKHYTLKKTHFIREEWIMNKFDSLKNFLISIPIGYV